MPTFKVTGPISVLIDLTFEADSESAAWEIFDERICASVSLIDYDHEVADDSIYESNVAIRKL